MTTENKVADIQMEVSESETEDNSQGTCSRLFQAYLRVVSRFLFMIVLNLALIPLYIYTLNYQSFGFNYSSLYACYDRTNGTLVSFDTLGINNVNQVYYTCEISNPNYVLQYYYGDELCRDYRFDGDTMFAMVFVIMSFWMLYTFITTQFQWFNKHTLISRILNTIFGLFFFAEFVHVSVVLIINDQSDITSVQRYESDWCRDIRAGFAPFVGSYLSGLLYCSLVCGRELVLVLFTKLTSEESFHYLENNGYVSDDLYLPERLKLKMAFLILYTFWDMIDLGLDIGALVTSKSPLATGFLAFAGLFSLLSVIVWLIACYRYAKKGNFIFYLLACFSWFTIFCCPIHPTPASELVAHRKVMTVFATLLEDFPGFIGALINLISESGNKNTNGLATFFNIGIIFVSGVKIMYVLRKPCVSHWHNVIASFDDDVNDDDKNNHKNKNNDEQVGQLKITL